MNYQNGQDVLAFTNQLGITGNWVPATGTLTLTGPAAVADFQTALRSVTYSNTSQAPNTTARTVQFVVSDGETTSAPVTKSVAVVSVNDAPSVTAGGTLNFTEGNAPTAIDNTITVVDVDDTNIELGDRADHGQLRQRAGRAGLAGHARASAARSTPRAGR